MLEQLQQQKVTIGGKSKSLMSNVDLVVGVSGGSVLAAYFALKGEETIPMFYKLSFTKTSNAKSSNKPSP